VGRFQRQGFSAPVLNAEPFSEQSVYRTFGFGKGKLGRAPSLLLQNHNRVVSALRALVTSLIGALFEQR
jgi:hypothetical protein